MRTLTQEQGKPLPEAKAEILHSADTFEWFAEEGKRTYGRTIPPSNIAKRHYAIKHAVGVVGNHPELPRGFAEPEDCAGIGRRLYGRAAWPSRRR